MFGEDKNIKDNTTNSLKDTAGETSNVPVRYKSEGVTIGSYNKTDKLISALYMVTDILEKDEPIRTRLRTLGAGILSDIHAIYSLYRTNTNSENSLARITESKILETISFLEIASSVGIISAMNVNILRKEFIQLNQAIKEYTDTNLTWLEKFILEEKNPTENYGGYPSVENGGVASVPSVPSRTNTSGHDKKTMDKLVMSNRKGHSDIKDIALLKGQRRGEILKIIKAFPEGATITDIHSGASGVLLACGEKTLQRELVSMVGDGVLKKGGEKRWSKYSLGLKA